jgi:hypothetical protein
MASSNYQRRSQAKTYQKKSFSIALGSELEDGLDALFDDFTNKCCRPAAFAASTVLYDEMKLRVPEKTGTLLSSIYRFREKDTHSNLDKAIFYVGPNKRIARHWSLVEHGHFQIYKTYFDAERDTWVTIRNEPLATPKFIPAQPYIRPTYDAKIELALKTGLQVLKQRFNDKSSNQTLLY